MVADYPIGVLVVALAVLGVTADAHAQGPIKVGYYDMNIGAGVTAEQEPPIVAAGFTPVQLNSVTATDLAGLHVLFVQNSSPNAYGTEHLASKAAVQDAVNADEPVVNDQHESVAFDCQGETILGGSWLILVTAERSDGAKDVLGTIRGQVLNGSFEPDGDSTRITVRDVLLAVTEGTGQYAAVAEGSGALDATSDPRDTPQFVGRLGLTF